MTIITPLTFIPTHTNKMDFSAESAAAPEQKNFIKKKVVPAVKKVFPVVERVLPVAATLVPGLAPAAAVVGAISSLKK
jgi:hypothetical protein